MQHLLDVADINWNSPMQVAEVLYTTLKFKELVDRKKQPVRTSSGRPKADISTIKQLHASKKEQKKVKELLLRRSAVEAALSKTLSKFKECCDNGDKLFAQFNQAVTQTHRLSSSGTEYGVQFQNMPRQYKPLIKPVSDDYLMVEADGSQLEFRVAAYLGQDEQAVYDIVNGTDIHQYTADTITAAGQPTTRQPAKSHTFKPLYGGMSGTPAEVAYYKDFREKYAGIAAAQERWKIEALKDKKIRLASGLEMFFPDIKPSRSKDGYIPEQTSICNYPVQSLATAEIIPINLIYAWHAIKAAGLRTRIVNTVHDSIVMEVHKEEVKEVEEIVLTSFGEKCYSYLSEVYRIQFNVPLGCGIKIGDRWGTGTETSYTLNCG